MSARLAVLAALLMSLPGSILADESERVAQAAPTHSLPAEIVDAKWEWVWFGSGKEQFDVEKPERYVLEFLPEGRVALKLDCNRGTGGYALDGDMRISFGLLATTQMLCVDESRVAEFVAGLEQVAIYSIFEGDLLLEAPADSGTLRFRRVSAD